MENKTYHIYLTFPSDVKIKENEGSMSFVVNSIDGFSLGNGFDTVLTTSETAIKYLYSKELQLNPAFQLDRVFLLKSSLIDKPILEKLNRNSEISKKGLSKELQAKYPRFGASPTHLKVFCEQANDFLEEYCHMDGVFKDRHVDENGIIESVSCDVLNDAEQLKQSIRELSQRIIEYKKTLPIGSHIKMYIDTSGGFRNAAMIFIVIGRIMSYIGIELSGMYYTSYSGDKVVCHEIKDIYNLLDLVAGFEEFQLFGSAKKLKDYFEHKRVDLVPTLSPDLQSISHTDSLQSLSHLWTAVDEFADIINISRRGSFEKALMLLTDSLQIIKSEEVRGDLDSSFISFLQEPIEASYAPLIESFNFEDNTINPVRAVEWCLNHDYLQQALTLFIEYIPDYLIKQGFINVNYDIFIEYIKKRNLAEDINIISKAFHLFIDKNKETEELSFINLTFDQFVQAYRDEKMKDKSEDVRSDANLVFNELNSARSKLVNIYSKKDDVYKKLHPLLIEYIKTIRGAIWQSKQGKLEVNLNQKIIDIKSEYRNNFRKCIETEGYILINDESTLLYKLVEYIAILAEENESLVFKMFSELPQELRDAICKADKEGEILKWIREDTYEIDRVVDIKQFLENFRKPFYDLLQENLSEAKAKLYKGLIRGINLKTYDFKREVQDVEKSNLNPLYGVDGVTVSRQESNDIQKIIEILAYYSEIKKSRNDSNHARMEESSQFTTSEEIRNAMTRCIILIDELQR